MLTNEQLEKMWWQYKEEGIAKNLSLQAFCSIHNIAYNAFEKYLKLRRHFSDVHERLLDQILTDNAVTYCDETWERRHLKVLTKRLFAKAEQTMKTCCLHHWHRSMTKNQLKNLKFNSKNSHATVPMNIALNAIFLLIILS